MVSSSPAEEIYKSIENGVIQYSTVPPASNEVVETITTFPEPSEEDIKAAQQELKKLRDNLEKREEPPVEEQQTETSEEGGSSPPNRNPFPALAPFL